MNTNSGAMISGKWFNPNDGTVINVMDTIIDENNQMVVVTDRGTVDMNTFSSNFIQCDDATLTQMKPANSVATSSLKIESKVKPSNDFIMADELINSMDEQQVVVKVNKSSNSSSIIEKLFNKIDSKPDIKISIEWDDFPVEQVNMLINFLDVKESDISRYIQDNYLDEYSILLALEDFLKGKLKGGL